LKRSRRHVRFETPLAGPLTLSTARIALSAQGEANSCRATRLERNRPRTVSLQPAAIQPCSSISMTASIGLISTEHGFKELPQPCRCVFARSSRQKTATCRTTCLVTRVSRSGFWQSSLVRGLQCCFIDECRLMTTQSLERRRCKTDREVVDRCMTAVQPRQSCMYVELSLAHSLEWLAWTRVGGPSILGWQCFWCSSWRTAE